MLPAARAEGQEPARRDHSTARHGPGDTEGGSSGCRPFCPRGVGGREREPLPLRLAEGQLPVSPVLPALGQGTQAARRGPGRERRREGSRSGR